MASMDFLTNVAIASLFIWGIKCLFSDGFILGGVGLYLEKQIGTWASKPLFLCPPCMASFHGTIYYVSNFGLSKEVIPFIICLCGLNYLLVEMIYAFQEEEE